MALTRDEKHEITELLEECIEDILGNVEPEDMEKVGEYIKQKADAHVDYLVAAQKQILA